MGLAIAAVLVGVRRRIDEPLVEITLSLATPYSTYVLAQAAGLSGILATVAAGVYVGSRAARSTPATARLQAFAFLDVLVFLLNAVLFTLVGMQLARVAHQVPGVPTARVVGAVTAVTAVVIVARLAWMLTGPGIARLLRRRRSTVEWRERALVGWAGMRGGVSLAAALAVPLTLADGSLFPFRDLIIVIAATVIVATLVVQGTTLPWLLKMLGIASDDHGDEERRARLHAARAALNWLNNQEASTRHGQREVAETLRALYAARIRRLQAALDGELDGDSEVQDRGASYLTLRLGLLEAERLALRDWRAQGHLTATVLRAIERSLDLEEARIRGS